MIEVRLCRKTRVHNWRLLKYNFLGIGTETFWEGTLSHMSIEGKR